MPVERFLSEHWQKKPLLVRGAFPKFRDLISPDELAGLSCEDGVESRIVREKGGAYPWEVTWGPHPESRFEELPEEGWTILVQELHRHVPKAALLLDAFSFVPNVRVDDVMVSFAAPGGSVGPHLDSYDVFLVQGSGERRWQFHRRKTKDVRLLEGLDLRILERFVPEVDEVLSSGDMLYLPPGFAHYGVAVSPCLTYSVGFRAPSHAEMWKDFAESLSSRPDACRLLEDPPLRVTDPGAIPPAMLARVREVIRTMDPSDEAIDRWFASFATRLGPGRTMQEKSRPETEASVRAKLERGGVVVRSEEGRWAYLPVGETRGLRLYVGGNEIDVPPSASELARLLCSKRRFDAHTIAVECERSRASKDLIVRLFRLDALRVRAVRSSTKERASAR